VSAVAAAVWVDVLRGVPVGRVPQSWVIGDLVGGDGVTVNRDDLHELARGLVDCHPAARHGDAAGGQGLEAGVLLAALGDAVPVDLAEGFEAEGDRAQIVLPAVEGVGGVAQRPDVGVGQGQHDAGVLLAGVGARATVQAELVGGDRDLEHGVAGAQGVELAGEQREGAAQRRAELRPGVLVRGGEGAGPGGERPDVEARRVVRHAGATSCSSCWLMGVSPAAAAHAAQRLPQG
jgi:hypothetical protein